MIPYLELPDVRLGSVPIHWFGLLVAMGVMSGISLARWRADKVGIERGAFDSVIGWMLAGGFVGAHVLDTIFYHPGELLRRPWSLLFLWEGLSSFGGFVGGLAGVLLSVFPVAWIFGRDHPGQRTSSDNPLAVAYGVAWGFSCSVSIWRFARSPNQILDTVRASLGKIYIVGRALVASALVLAMLGDAGGDPPRRSTKARPSQQVSRVSPHSETRGGVENVAPRPASPAEQALQGALDRALRSRWMKQAVNAVLVVDVRTGRTLYSSGADRQLNPASNVKLISTAAALEALGPDFVYTTRVLGAPPNSDGVMVGDLYLHGSWDPTFRMSDLKTLATALADRGIKRVEGAVVVGLGERRDRIDAPVVRIVVVGGDRNGDSPTVTVDPIPHLFAVTSKATTSSKGRRAKLSVSLAETPSEKLVVTVSGRVRPGQRAVVHRRVPRGAWFTGHVLLQHLADSGIEVKGGIRREVEPPEGLALLAAHHSQPLATIAAWVNKPSDNWLAERVIWTTGKTLYGGDLGTANGLRAMEAFLQSIGIERGTYRLDNGSGLSHTSHLSARQLVRVLLHGYQDARIASPYLASLSVAGVDGTLRERMRGHLAEGHVFGKTGTMAGVASLSGFVTTEGGDALAFVILSNGFRSRRARSIRAAHHDMVNAMYRYLTEREPPLPYVKF